MAVKLGPYDVPGFATGDCRALMADLPDGCVQMAVTSPPYWGLRVYSGDQAVPWDDGSRCPFGNEDTPEAYVAHTVEVLRAVRRVLRDDGVCFRNVGDSYVTTPAGNREPSGKSQTDPARVCVPLETYNSRPKRGQYLKQKDLCLIPHRVAIAAQADGWYVRSDIIWAKPSPMPESVTDRPTSAHEHIIMLTKSARYFWDADGVREWAGGLKTGGFSARTDAARKEAMSGGKPSDVRGQSWSTRNIRNVWTIPTRPYSGAHFAVFPPKIPETCIKAATPIKSCAKCGAPWERVVERETYREKAPTRDMSKTPLNVVRAGWRNPENQPKNITTGHRPTCTCDADTCPAIVLDPFCGSGTTCAVAEDLGRLWLGFDISEEYRELQKERTAQVSMTGALLGGSE